MHSVAIDRLTNFYRAVNAVCCAVKRGAIIVVNGIIKGTSWHRLGVRRVHGGNDPISTVAHLFLGLVSINGCGASPGLDLLL